ncbi:dehydrogenase/reductase SDR family member 11-like [Schistocerca piceifrons]|uniref:dehydrogenase/reductase SDR family member 11-like n=1 Tax=Schistocerca piceifrons TaxID=274613 RepID=UPI001F5EA09C|nr:dehydrogenase/reductase SDR family member 11-like [Schistocerca piceifrons]
MGIEKYAGRVAMVTGANSGIGFATTQVLLSHGITVVGFDKAVDKLQSLKLKDATSNLHVMEGDLRNEDSILAAFKWIRDHLSGVDIMINNAGLCKNAELTSARTDIWRDLLDVNVLGLSICTREAVQDMLSRGVDDGFVIHICSICGHILPFNSDVAMYCASKQAVKTLLEGLRKDLVARKSKIRVGEISPGLTRTAIASEKIYDIFPCMEPEDVAGAVVYMLSQHPRVQVHEIIIRPTGFDY